MTHICISKLSHHCHLFSAKPLSERMLAYCQSDPWEQSTMKSEAEYNKFHSIRCYWKCFLHRDVHFCFGLHVLTHWGQVTHICVSDLTSIGSDNGLSPGRRQVIIRTNAGILLIRPLGTNFRESLVKIIIFSFKKMHLKVSSAKCCSFRLGLNVLRLSVYQSRDPHECRGCNGRQTELWLLLEAWETAAGFWHCAWLALAPAPALACLRLSLTELPSAYSEPLKAS